MMFRLVWCVLFLTACGASQVPEASKTERTEPASLSGQSPIDLFGWAVLDGEGRYHESIAALPMVDRIQLHKLISSQHVDGVEIKAHLKRMSERLLLRRSDRRPDLSHRGQIKQRQNSSRTENTEAIRTVSFSNRIRSLQCYEMRKVYAETRTVSSPIDAVVRDAWKRWGVEPEKYSLPPVPAVNTKAFLLIDMKTQGLRLYVYEEVDDAADSELSEVVILCPFQNIDRIATLSE